MRPFWDVTYRSPEPLVFSMNGCPQIASVWILWKLNIFSLAPASSLLSLTWSPFRMSFLPLSSLLLLGVILDQELSFAKHISSLMRSCFYQLRQLRVVSRSLSSSSTVTLVQRFPNCGPRTPGGPWGSDRGSAKNFSCFVDKFLL